jgi:hypothetical protein
VEMEIFGEDQRIYPNAKGIEKNINLFYSIGRSKPRYIDFYDTKYGLYEDYDLVFVGWMDLGGL